MRRLTETQREIVAKIERAGGEALRYGGVYVAGGFTLCDSDITLMVRKGAVVLERIGGSVFAKPTEPARRSLEDKHSG